MWGDTIIKNNFEENCNMLTEWEAKHMMQKWGLPVTNDYLIKNIDELDNICKELTFPIVLKVSSPDIIHKSDVGGVISNIKNIDEAKKAYLDISNNIKKNCPLAFIEGFIVAEMSIGIEMFLGIKKDSIFGYFVLLGAGGTAVELYNDITMRRLPVSYKDIKKMFNELKCKPLLEGYRGSKLADIEALEKVIICLSNQVIEHSEILEIDLNPILVKTESKGCVIADARVLVSNEEQKKIEDINKKLSFDNNEKLIALDTMFNPKSIAIVGASNDANKLGGRVIKYLLNHGYPGKLIPINPKEKKIFGINCYSHLGEVKEDIDLACFLIPSDKIIDMIRNIRTDHVKTAIIFASGYGEVGIEGKLAQENLVLEMRNKNITICGPNTAGIINPVSQLYASFSMCLEMDKIPKGGIGFISQSGALGGSILSRAWTQEVGFSRCVFSGNEAEIDTSDILEYLIEDENTKVITLYIEGIKNGDKFIECAKKAIKKRKPIICYKAGRTSLGREAIISHTGSLAGEDEIFNVICKQYGVIRVNQIMDLFDIAIEFEKSQFMQGNKVAVISTSGGACSIAADECSKRCLKIPKLADETQEKIKKIVPSYGTWKNPIDVTGQVISNPELFKKTLEIIIDDQNIDALLIIITTSADPLAERLAQDMSDVLKKNTKPAIICWTVAEPLARKGMTYLKQVGIPFYSDPETAVLVLSEMAQYGMII